MHSWHRKTQSCLNKMKWSSFGTQTLSFLKVLKVLGLEHCLFWKFWDSNIVFFCYEWLKDVRAKLRKLELGLFDSNPIKWQSFETRLEPQFVHINFSISYILDSTFTSISGLSLNLENYKLTFKLLQDLYGSQTVIAGVL